MLVKVKSEGQVIIPVIEMVPDKPTTVPSGYVRLMPGWNDVPDEQWSVIKRDLREKMEQGLIELQGRKVKDDDGVEQIEGIPLRDVNAITANKIIKECFNIDCLNKWLENTEGRRETRDEIRVAIKEQIALINSGGEKNS